MLAIHEHTERDPSSLKDQLMASGGCGVQRRSTGTAPTKPRRFLVNKDSADKTVLGELRH